MELEAFSTDLLFLSIDVFFGIPLNLFITTLSLMEYGLIHRSDKKLCTVKEDCIKFVEIRYLFPRIVLEFPEDVSYRSKGWFSLATKPE